MTTIYTLTDEISRQKWAYTSLKAMFLHEDNDLYLYLNIQQYYRILKKNDGKHPISIESFTIEKGYAFNVEDVKKANQEGGVANE
jgi:hypothetical protein